MTIMFFLASFLYVKYADEFDPEQFDPEQSDIKQELLGKEDSNQIGGDYLLAFDGNISREYLENTGGK